ncbi:MAG: SRPBCC family protein [Acidimicrobiales bacterium]
MASTPDLTVTRDVAAPAEAVWALVSDLTRMPDWSPENDEVVWLGGATAIAVGAKFQGTNHHGKRSWKTTGEVTSLEPGRSLAFLITAGPIKVAEWGYAVEATEGGCRLTETWTDRRGGFMKFASKLVTGVEDREAHNSSGMEATLQRIAAAAEGESPCPSP